MALSDTIHQDPVASFAPGISAVLDDGPLDFQCRFAGGCASNFDRILVSVYAQYYSTVYVCMKILRILFFL